MNLFVQRRILFYLAFWSSETFSYSTFKSDLATFCLNLHSLHNDGFLTAGHLRVNIQQIKSLYLVLVAHFLVVLV